MSSPICLYIYIIVLLSNFKFTNWTFLIDDVIQFLVALSPKTITRFVPIMKNCQILASALCAYVIVESNSVDLKIFEEYGINRLRWNQQRKTYVNRSKVSWLFDTPFRTYPLLEIIFEFNKPFSKYNSETHSSVLCPQCFIHNLLWNVFIFGQTSAKDFSKSFKKLLWQKQSTKPPGKGRSKASTVVKDFSH